MQVDSGITDGRAADNGDDPLSQRRRELQAWFDAKIPSKKDIERPMSIIIRHLRVLICDPTMYFGILPERNNLELICNMVIRTHLVLGDDDRYLGFRINFANCWASDARWGLGASDIDDLYHCRREDWENYCYIQATGTLRDGNIVYEFYAFMGNEYDCDHINGTATFAPDGTELCFAEHNRYDNGLSIGKWLLRCLVGPDSIVNPLIKEHSIRRKAVLDQWREHTSQELTELQVADKAQDTNSTDVER